jgi:hypothetical protein
MQWNRMLLAEFVRQHKRGNQRVEVYVRSTEPGMRPRLPIPASPEFDRVAQGAQFRDRIAIVVRASPEAIFRSVRQR